MGLSDDYVLPSNYNDAYGLMGDGVVVPVVRFWRSTSSSLFCRRRPAVPARRAIA